MKMVRDGRKVWPYCPECGCRLALVYGGIHQPNKYIVAHFGNDPRFDARGCQCDLLNDFRIVEKEYLTNFIS